MASDPQPPKVGERHRATLTRTSSFRKGPCALISHRDRGIVSIQFDETVQLPEGHEGVVQFMPQGHWFFTPNPFPLPTEEVEHIQYDNVTSDGFIIVTTPEGP